MWIPFCWNCGTAQAGIAENGPGSSLTAARNLDHECVIGIGCSCCSYTGAPRASRYKSGVCIAFAKQKACLNDAMPSKHFTLSTVPRHHEMRDPYGVIIK